MFNNQIKLNNQPYSFSNNIIKNNKKINNNNKC